MFWEYVIVLFPTVRDVFIDTHRIGPTNQVFRIRRGHHSFSLGNPVSYTPAMQVMNIVNTTMMRPAVVMFTPV